MFKDLCERVGEEWLQELEVIKSIKETALSKIQESRYTHGFSVIMIGCTRPAQAPARYNPYMCIGMDMKSHL